jgi:hypothetical protein
MSFIAAMVANQDGGAVVVMAALMTLGNGFCLYVHRFSKRADDLCLLYKDRLYNTLGSNASFCDILGHVHNVLFYKLDLAYGYFLLFGGNFCVWTLPHH